MKLREAVSWLTGTLQRQLFPRLEECWESPLTEKEQQLVSILEVLQIEKFAGRPAQRFGRKPWERQAMARAFVGKAVYNQPTTRATIEALQASPNFRRICGFVRAAISLPRPRFPGPLGNSPATGWARGSTKPWWPVMCSRDWWAISAGTPRPSGAGKNLGESRRPPSRRPGKPADPGGGRCEPRKRRRGRSTVM